MRGFPTTADSPPLDSATGSVSRSGVTHVDGQSGDPVFRADGGSTIIDRSDLPTALPDATVGGVLLAAGTSTRFGSGNKLLATVAGESVVRRAATTLCESALDDVVVVVGFEADRIRAELDDLDVAIVHNDAYAAGQHTSVHRGVTAARDRDWDATVFGLGDMPAVDPTSVDLLLRAYAAGVGRVLPAAFEGKRGNPVLFDASTYEDLLTVADDTGGRRVIRAADDVALVETGDPGIVRDVDVDADLERFE